MGGAALIPVTIRGALAPDRCRSLLDAIESALEHQGLSDRGRWLGTQDFIPNHSETWVAIQQAVLGTTVMDEAREHLAARIAEAVGESVSPRRADVVRVFAPGSEETTPAHQDAHYFREPAPRFVAWVALTEAGRGGLEIYRPDAPVCSVLPHRGEHPAGPYLDDPPPGTWSRPRLQPGDVVLFDVFTIHRGTANPSDEPRISVDLRFDDQRRSCRP